MTRARWIVAALSVALALIVGGLDVAASGILTTSLTLKINATGSSTAHGLSTVTDPVSSDYTLSLSSGTGANQASNFFHDQRTLSASASEDLDLAGVLTNGFGTTLTFTKIKAIIIHAAAGNTNNVVIGGAVSNTFINWVADPTDKIVVRPGGTFILVAPDATGYGVTAGTADLLHIANSGAGTSVTYDVVIIGVD